MTNSVILTFTTHLGIKWQQMQTDPTHTYHLFPLIDIKYKPFFFNDIKFDIIIFLSQNAILAFNHQMSLFNVLPNKKLWVIGQESGLLLEKLGISSHNITYPKLSYDFKSLLQENLPDLPFGTKFLIVKGLDSKTDPANNNSKNTLDPSSSPYHQFQFEFLDVYERHLPFLNQSNLDKLQLWIKEKAIWVFGSRKALSYFVTLVEKHLIPNIYIVTIHPHITSYAEKCGFKLIKTINTIPKDLKLSLTFD